MAMKNELDFLQNKAHRLRLHALEMTSRAGSGHPTSCFSCAEIMSALFFHEMRYDPHHMEYLDNDEFVLSKGHAAPVLYAALAEAGVLSVEEIMGLRSFDSRIEGHPVPTLPGIRVATGSLGQGLSAGLGMALAMRLDTINRRVFVLLGDGEMAEGSVWEAISMASYLGVTNMVAIVDMNRLGQSDPTMHGWNARLHVEKARACGWQAKAVNGHSLPAILSALKAARRSTKPTFIVAKTVKGKGVSFLENQNSRHGTALKGEEYEQARQEIAQRLRPPEGKSHTIITAIKKPAPSSPALTVTTAYQKDEQIATRAAYGKALEKLGAQDPQMVVLDGDVKNSTCTEYFFKKYPKRSVQCFIAEQNMIGLAVGLQSRGKHVFAATFAAFLTRAYDQIRMAVYSRANLKLAGSHCGVSIGEDGPSQMALEDIAMVRALLGSVVLYPCDAVSAEKLTVLSANYEGISYLRTTRPKTPVIYGNGEEFCIGGSKVVQSSPHDKATVVSAGITVHEALKAAGELEQEGIPIRVIDAYSIKPIDQATLQQAAQEVGAIITVEDHVAEGGLGDAVAQAVAGIPVYRLAVTKMPHSGTGPELLAEQGIDATGIVRKVKEILG